MTTYILRERPLNDDELLIPDDGKVFKGNYIAILNYYTFLNSWNDKKHVKRFRTVKALNAFLKKHYAQDELEKLGF